MTRGWARLPVRLRLVGGFVLAMLLLLASAGAFVLWRVEVSLDRTLDTELAAVNQELHDAIIEHPDQSAAALADLPAATVAQLLDGRGGVVASTPSARGLVLLRPDHPVVGVLEPGSFLNRDPSRRRILVRRLSNGDLAVAAVSLRQRDEALRELVAQLALAQGAALALAAVVGYRLTRGALRPVEAYRRQAERIADGASGMRLAVPEAPDDEITRLGHTLNDMLGSLEETARRQRQFLADASHELRSPLTVLSSEVELALRRPRSTTEYEQTLQQVAVDTARLVALADQLLALEQGLLPGGTCDLTEVARDVLARLQDGDRPLVPDLGGPVNVSLGSVEAGQLVTNLVTNALVHGCGTVTVSVAVVAGTAILQVHDDGPGPPAEFVPHAVERFRRADLARTTPGSGLGLALVHQVAAVHGGELRLCSGGSHHRYPPLHFDLPCRHSQLGTAVSVLVPVAP